MRFPFPYLLIVFLLLQSCKNPANENIQTEPASSDIQVRSLSFKDSLVEKPIDTTGFFISVPPDFTIGSLWTSNAFYCPIGNPDTTIHSAFQGMLIMFHNESDIQLSANDHPEQRRKGRILGEEKEWRIYGYEGDLTIETVVKWRHPYGAKTPVRVIGYGKTTEDLEKMLTIFSTMKQKQRN